MFYVSVECPECGQENEVDEKLKKFYCLKCGTECNLEYEPIYEPEEDAPKAPTTSSDEEAGRRLKRAALFLEDKDWARAWSYCESVLDYDPENSEAYFIELLVTLRLDSADELKTCKVDYRNHPLFEKAMRFADGERRAELEAVQNYEKNFARYTHAKKYMQSANKPGGSATTRQRLLESSATIFESLGSFEDSAELADECRQMMMPR